MTAVLSELKQSARTSVAAAVESGRMVEWLAMREPPPDDEVGTA